MKRYIKILFLLAGSILLLSSCSREETLQQYYIHSQDKDNFISIDIPSSIISLKDDVPEETREAFNSLKKLNILAFKVDSANVSEYKLEKGKVKKILKSKKFNELIRVKHENANIMVKYLGDDEAIDEIVVYAADDDKGFALVRVIGKDIKPEKIIKMIKNIDKLDKDGSVTSQIKDLIKGIE